MRQFIWGRLAVPVCWWARSQVLQAPLSGRSDRAYWTILLLPDQPVI